jgi:glycosyltransferase involved in cell wall biosynthesis
MKILYFYQYFTTPRGSYSTRMYELGRRWAAQGHEVTVITSVYDKSGLNPERRIERMNIQGIDVRIVNIRLSNKDGFLKRVFTFAAYSMAACWYALTLPADVVVSSSGPITVGLPGLVARYLRGRAFVFEVRDLWPEGAIQLGVLRNPILIRIARAFEGICYRSAHHIIALSPGMADWIREHYGDRRITVAPNASDNELFERVKDDFHPPEWAAGKQLVLYTGTIGFGDDCGQIVEMARRLDGETRKKVEVVMIGEGNIRKELEARCAETGAPVRFLGSMPKEEVYAWLGHAACALCTTRDVPFYGTCSPNKVFDAFAAGAPVVQTTQGWLKKLLEREQCGVTTPQNDPEAMAAAITRLVDDPALQRRLSANASRVAREQFDRGLIAARMAGAFEEAFQTRIGRESAVPA